HLRCFLAAKERKERKEVEEETTKGVPQAKRHCPATRRISVFLLLSFSSVFCGLIILGLWPKPQFKLRVRLLDGLRQHSFSAPSAKRWPGFDVSIVLFCGSAYDVTIVRKVRLTLGVLTFLDFGRLCSQ